MKVRKDKALKTFPATSFDIKLMQSTLFAALVDAAKLYGSSRIILEDHERRPMTYGRLITASLALGRKLADLSEKGEHIGVMLPNAQGLVPVLFGLNAFGRVPAMLNYTAGIRNLQAACEVASLKVILTSKRFIEQGKLDDIVAAFEEDGRRIVYLEDIRDTITTFDKLKGMLGTWFAKQVHARYAVKPDDKAAILFTSGSEGKPKGVVLSNANLLANSRQIEGRVRPVLTQDDVIFNPLPMFHSFGLTAGAILWLISGYKVVLYPTPLHFRQIPKLIAGTGATIVVSTDTFARHYARAGEGDNLSKVRYIVAGAEPVRAETRELWEKHGTVLLEGYGVTECSPILAVNLPDAFKLGTVGRLLPGIEARLEQVEGLSEGGRLYVRGPNIMQGYLSTESEGKLVTPPDGWHDTGDIVSIDDGFITIRGRAKRFAKIGGEMVSLAAVESVVQRLWPDDNHVVISLPDSRKGEQLILVTSRETADKDELLVFAQEQGFPELWVPKSILVSQIPVLGSGKIDYASTVELVKNLRAML
ncbi:AMP-binding protein [Microvirga sp. W0021]|uniref:AMP-binding protein n=1 Tax=Hohaiivirga grylli TaxID=3133970 RepID=A0ABV0BNV5_9HYPH